MAGMLGALPRKFLFLFGTAVGCVVLLLFASGWVGAGQMVASWYGPGFEGTTTASGEPFNPNDYTAAHRELPFETRLIVTYGERSVVVRVNDRGPYVAGRDLDLSQAAAQYLGLTSVGEATVGVTVADSSVATGPYIPEATASSPTASPATTSSATASPEMTTLETAPPRASRAERGRWENRADGLRAPLDEERNPAATQYADELQAGIRAVPPPAETWPVAPPPAPDPSRIEAPPAELATPGSTVERRVELRIAAPPERYQGPPPAGRKPTARPSRGGVGSEPIASEELERPTGPTGLTVLPETGGAPLSALLGGVLLVGFGITVIRRPRR